MFYVFRLLSFLEKKIFQNKKFFQKSESALFEQIFSKIIREKRAQKSNSKMYESNCFFKNYNFTREYKLQHYIEFLNSNGFKLHSSAQIQTMPSQLCSTIIGKVDFTIVLLLIQFKAHFT